MSASDTQTQVVTEAQVAEVKVDGAKASKIKHVDAEYKDVNLPTLRAWLRYWEGVKAGTRKLTTGSKDTVEMAPAEISKLTKEIEARTKAEKTA